MQLNYYYIYNCLLCLVFSSTIFAFVVWLAFLLLLHRCAPCLAVGAFFATKSVFLLAFFFGWRKYKISFLIIIIWLFFSLDFCFFFFKFYDGRWIVGLVIWFFRLVYFDLFKAWLIRSFYSFLRGFLVWSLLINSISE